LQAVVRAERSEPAEFAAVLVEALRHLEGWGQRDRVGWQQLVRMMLYWGIFRRPREEHASILAAVRSSVSNVDLLREVETMSNQLGQTWEQELLATGRQQGEQLGEKRGEQRGEQRGETKGELKAYREILRTLLADRFAPLPEGVLQRINSAELPWLKAALDRIKSLKSLDELPS